MFNHEVLWKHWSDFYYFSLSCLNACNSNRSQNCFLWSQPALPSQPGFLPGTATWVRAKAALWLHSPSGPGPASALRVWAGDTHRPRPGRPAAAGPEGKQAEGGRRNCWGQIAGWGRSDRLRDSTTRNSWISQPGKGALGEKQPKFTAPWRRALNNFSSMNLSDDLSGHVKRVQLQHPVAKKNTRYWITRSTRAC